MLRPLPVRIWLALALAAPNALDARAGATVDLLFVQIDGGAIPPTDSLPLCCTPGTQLGMVAVMRNDVALSSHAFSLNYDLLGRNELDVVHTGNWAGIAIDAQGGRYAPTGGLAPPTATFVGSYTGARSGSSGGLPPAAGAFASGYVVGSVVFTQTATTPLFDSSKILSGLFAPGDGFFDAAGSDIGASVLFRTARFGVPEPATGALLGLGVFALALARRRRGLSAWRALSSPEAASALPRGRCGRRRARAPRRAA